MNNQPQDFVPPPPPVEKIGIYTLPPAWLRNRSKPAARRGGKRPGSGAKPGNLNALKHGRTSRFKDILPFDPAAVAGRVLSQDRREAERIAQSFIRVLLEHRFKRDVADAVAEGRPLPAAPLLLPSRADRRRVTTFLEVAATVGDLEQQRAAGRISPDNAALVESRRAAEQLEAILPAVGAYLDRASTATLSAADITALLQNHHQNDQSRPTLIESAPSILATLSESTPPPTPQNETIKPATPTPPTRQPHTRRAGTSRHPSPNAGRGAEGGGQPISQPNSRADRNVPTRPPLPSGRGSGGRSAAPGGAKDAPSPHS